MFKIKYLFASALLIFVIWLIVTHRQSIETNEVVSLRDGKSISIHHIYSYDREYLHIWHLIKIGGENFQHEMRFNIEGHDYHWEEDYPPIIISIDESKPVIATRNNVYKWGANGWVEMPISNLKYENAVRNIWGSESGYYGDDYNLRQKQITDGFLSGGNYVDFLGTDTADLWEKLSCSVEEGEALENCLLAFKQNYIDKKSE